MKKFKVCLYDDRNTTEIIESRLPERAAEDFMEYSGHSIAPRFSYYAEVLCQEVNEHDESIGKELKIRVNIDARIYFDANIRED